MKTLQSKSIITTNMIGLLQKMLILMFLQVLSINGQACPGDTGTIVDVAENAGNFTTLISLVEIAGLSETLADPDIEITVFGE